MRIDLNALPNDVDALHAMIGAMLAERESERSEAQAEIDRLRNLVKTLQRSQFGRRSERLDQDQLHLGLEDLDADVARAEAALPETPASKTRPDRDVEGRPSLPDHLEREDVTLDVAAATYPCCGGEIHQIGESTSEMLDYVPARLRVVRIRRPKYGCRACGKLQQAPAPDRPIAKGLASAGLLAHVLVSKYCTHSALSPIAGLWTSWRPSQPASAHRHRPRCDQRPTLRRAGRPHFHGYYDCYCYMPLYIFCGRQLLGAKLRTSSVDTADGNVAEVALIVRRLAIERTPA